MQHVLGLHPRVFRLLKAAQYTVMNPTARHTCCLGWSYDMLQGWAKCGGQSIGKQLVVAIEEGDWVVAVHHSCEALVEQNYGTLCHGSWQSGMVLFK